MNAASPNITVALLDVDGTLVDSNDLHAHAWVDALSEAGFAVAFERVRPLLGMGGDNLLPELDLGLSDDAEPGKSIAARRGEIFKEHYLQHVKAFPGVRDLLVRLRENGVRPVIATSSKPDELQAALRIAAIPDLIDEAATSEDASKSKPAPDIVQVALKKAGVGAENAVMVGDTRFDIDAAKKAGVRVVAFRCGGSPENDLAGADAIYDGPAALTAALQTRSLGEMLASEA